MVTEKYIHRIKDIIKSFDSHGLNRYFVFGSSLRKDTFGDIDIGVVGTSNSGYDVYDLKDEFETSTFPYFVDVVDMDSAKKSFADYVFNKEEVLWLN